MPKPEYQDILHAAVVNFRTVWGNTAANLERIKQTISIAAASGIQMILFPELCLTGITRDAQATQRSEHMQIRMAETVPGPAANEIAALTQKLGIYAIWGMAERDPDDASVAYNAAVVCGPQGLVGSYRKIHPFDEEGEWTSSGTKPFMFDSPWGKVGIGICYDTYHFPELLRYYVANGCRLYLNPTAACNAPRENDDNGYQIFLKNTVANESIFVMSANGVGKEILDPCHGGNSPWRNGVGNELGGGSVIIGPSTLAGNMYRTHLYAGSWSNREFGVYNAVVDLSFASRALYNKNGILGRPDFRPELYAEWYRELADKKAEE